MNRRSLEDIEVYECAGCGGEVAVVEAIWLPESLCLGRQPLPSAEPYCSLECYEYVQMVDDGRMTRGWLEQIKDYVVHLRWAGRIHYDLLEELITEIERLWKATEKP